MLRMASETLPRALWEVSGALRETIWASWVSHRALEITTEAPRQGLGTVLGAPAASKAPRFFPGMSLWALVAIKKLPRALWEVSGAFRETIWAAWSPHGALEVATEAPREGLGTLLGSPTASKAPHFVPVRSLRVFRIAAGRYIYLCIYIYTYIYISIYIHI